MKIIDAHEGLVTNFEVYQLLLQQKREYKEIIQRIHAYRNENNSQCSNTSQNSKEGLSPKLTSRSVQEVGVLKDIAARRCKHLKMEIIFEKKLLYYLSSSPIRNQSTYSLLNLQTLFNEYGFSHEEQLHILNLCPSTEVEFNLIVKDCAERFSPEETLEFLRIFRSSVFRTEELSSSQLDEVLNK